MPVSALAHASTLPELPNSVARTHPGEYADVALALERNPTARRAILQTAVATATATAPSRKNPGMARIKRARAKLEKMLMHSRSPDDAAGPYGYENITAVGIGMKQIAGCDTGRPALVVTVANKTADDLVPLPVLVPPDIDGIPTDVVIGPRPHAAQCLVPIRPATGGISVSNGRFGSGTGTITCLVGDQYGNVYLLSCNHVLARLGDAAPGDPIVQPSIEDCGSVPAHVIAELRYAPKIDFTRGRTNRVDCALAITNPRLVSAFNDYFGRISATPVGVDDKTRVWKCGRSTRETASAVKQAHAAVFVEYDGGKTAHFSDIIVVEQGGKPFAAKGDSGALVLDTARNPVGMLISVTESWAYVVPMATILKRLGVHIVTTEASAIPARR